MRHLAIAAILALTACSNEAAQPPAPEAPEDAAAGSSGVGRLEGELAHDDPALYEDAKIAREQIIGSWSLDRTCASGYSMDLGADGKAGFDEWGIGTWEINADGNLVLTLQVWPGGADEPTGEVVKLVLTAAEPVTDVLLGNISSETPGYGSAVNAKRCPAS